MKIIWGLWPLLVAAIIAWPLNVTWFLVPNLRGWGVLDGWGLFILAEVLANLELPYWLWFWGWVGRNIQKLRPVKEVVKLSKETVNDLKKDHYVRQHYLDPIKNHFVGQYDWLTNPNNAVIRFLKWGGHAAMFGLGVEPFVPGLRIAGTFFCRTTRSKTGFVALLIGNFIHVAIMIWGWDFLLSKLGL